MTVFYVQPCLLYPNREPPQENLFVANAALWSATGDESFRNEADRWYGDSPKDMFLLSWNSAVPQVRCAAHPFASAACGVHLQTGNHGCCCVWLQCVLETFTHCES